MLLWRTKLFHQGPRGYRGGGEHLKKWDFTTRIFAKGLKPTGIAWGNETKLKGGDLCIRGLGMLEGKTTAG